MEIIISIGGYDIPKTNREMKGKSIIAFPDEYCVVDIETTGLSPEWDNIIEIGAVRYSKGQEAGRFQSLLKPPVQDDGTYIDDFICELTGITNEMLANAPEPPAVLDAFADFLRDDLIVGYNVGFDVNFLYDSFRETLGRYLSNNYIDAMRISRKLYPEMVHHRLKDMLDKFEIPQEHAHRALFDVEATKKCFDILREKALELYGTEEAFQKSFTKQGKGVKAIDIQGDASKQNPDSPLFNKRCVFTGKLEKFTRKEAMQIVADLGGINEDGITKKTNFLILGNNDYCSTIKDGKSTKQKKAEQYILNGQDIVIVPETVFYDMLEE